MYFKLCIWCVCGASHASHALSKTTLRSVEIIHPPTCQFHRGAVERWVPGTSFVHRLLSMENLSQNVDDFFSEGYVSGGAHGLVLNAEQQVRWPDCATPSGALDPPRSQLTSSLHLFPHHLAASSGTLTVVTARSKIRQNSRQSALKYRALMGRPPLPLRTAYIRGTYSRVHTQTLTKHKQG